MPRFKRKYSFAMLTETGKLKATACNSFTLYNAGNVNVTIDRILVLQPGDCWPDNNDTVDIEDDHEFSIEFNIGDGLPPPSFEAPVPGFGARDGSGTNPTGKFDTRVVLIKSHLSIA